MGVVGAYMSAVVRDTARGKKAGARIINSRITGGGGFKQQKRKVVNRSSRGSKLARSAEPKKN